MLRKTLSFICVLLLSVGAVRASGGVGVVMSGGGAKGLYHVGILEALEENGIPIDYVAGTSMGSIIAALYAAGYSPAEMRTLVNSGVIKEWVTGRIDPNKYKAYYRQVGQNPTMINMRLDFRGPKGKKFHSPTNLISATQIDMALTELLASASMASGGNFDRLMVPFLCVSSDMSARRGVVLRRGDLSLAVRSSMSIPLVFKPVKQDSMLLFDGGIYDNFPWKPLDKAFQPGLIIGCICTEGNTTPSENNTLMDQAFLLAMHESDYSLPEGRSVRIERNVGVGMLDFDSAEATMNAGYADAMKAMPELLKHIPERWTAEQYTERRREFRARCAPLVFDEYDFQGLTPERQEFMQDFVKTKRQSGEPRELTFEELRQNLFGVLASGDFSMEFPHVKYDSVCGRYSFAATFVTKPNFKIAVGGNISSTAFNQAYVGVSYQNIGRVAQQFGADLYLGPLYTWGTVGGRTDFYIWKPVFLDYSFNFSVHNLRHGSFGNVTRIDNTMEVKNSDVFFSLGAGMPLTHRSLFSLRANAGHVNYRYPAEVLIPADDDRTRYSFFGLKAEVARNTLDKPLHPRRGSDLKLSAIVVSGREKYQPYTESSFTTKENQTWYGARFSWDKYFDLPACKWFSFGLNFDATITNHPGFITGGATLMSMPAYAPVPHSRMIFMPDYRARRFVAGGILPTFDLLPNFFFRTGFYAMYREKHNYTPQFQSPDEDDKSFHYIAEASLVYHTPIGPVSLALTKYDFRSWKNMYLTFNFGYAIFAPRGTFY